MRRFKIPTKTNILLVFAALFTFLYLLFVLFFHKTSEPYLGILDFVENAPSNEVGDFLAGVFSPLAFLWLVVGYLLQSEELKLQRTELSQQREELSRTSQSVSAQASYIKEQMLIERMRFLPRFFLNFGTNTASERGFSLSIENAPAYDVSFDSIDTSISSVPVFLAKFRPSIQVDPKKADNFLIVISFTDASGRQWSQKVGCKNGKTFAGSTIESKEQFDWE